MYGTSFVSVVAVPQASGLAIGASGPPLKCRITSLKGCCGFLTKLAVTRPVVSLSVTVPLRRTVTP